MNRGHRKPTSIKIQRHVSFLFKVGYRHSEPDICGEDHLGLSFRFRGATLFGAADLGETRARGGSNCSSHPLPLVPPSPPGASFTHDFIS